MKLKSFTLKQAFPYILVVGGIIGLLCSGILTIEKIALLKNPAAQLNCNLNPVISCGSIVSSDQASAFGFANTLIGIAGFAVVITIGMALLAGASFKRWFWRGLEIGTIFGLGFVHWLIFQALYRINALCPYCMVVWVVTITLFWYTTLYSLREGYIPTPKACKSFVAFLQRHHIEILLVWFLIIIGLILQHFWYYWKTQF